MKNYDFSVRFRYLYNKAVHQYADGLRNAASFFSDEEKYFLSANGITAQHMYDYAEDHNAGGEPGYDNALPIELIRRDYFLNVQNGQASSHVLDETRLPAKTDSVKGIEWLPRLIPKAKAKLRGELPASLMYCCGGDRRFFKAHDILPAEFLSLVWRDENNDEAIIDWVVRRSQAPGSKAKVLSAPSLPQHQAAAGAA
jgi:Domain of unknown function (DUF5069)